jgi:glycosyltransferase involved in cell wall biosynthesis
MHLSVIIPTYNRSSYVRDCLVALSKAATPLEAIVSDDGSTDDTREVVAATNPAAIYLWQENTGTPATARNKGFAVSRGRYVGFLDCDDSWLPNAPEKAIEFLDKHPEVDVLFADAQMGNPEQGYVSWIQEAGQAAFFELPQSESEPGFLILDRRPFFRRMAVRNPVFIGACIMRREAFEKSGMFDATLCGAADWELWLRMATQFTFAYMTEPLAIYTRHLDNMSSNHDKMVGEFCQALEKVLQKCTLAPEDRSFIKSRLRHHLYHHAYLAYDAGHIPAARSRFWKTLTSGQLDLNTAVYWAACHMPNSLLGRLRRLKQSKIGLK